MIDLTLGQILTGATAGLIIATAIGFVIGSIRGQFGLKSEFKKCWTYALERQTAIVASIRLGHASDYRTVVEQAQRRGLGFLSEEQVTELLMNHDLPRGRRYVAFDGDSACMIDTTDRLPLMELLHSETIGMADPNLRLLMFDMRSAAIEDREPEQEATLAS